MSRARFLWIGLVVVALLLAGYTGYWFYVARQLDAGIDQWIADQARLGLEVSVERNPIGGFPLAFRTNFGKPHIVASVDGQPLDWRGADVAASMSPFDLRRVRFSAPGRHVVQSAAGQSTVEAATLTGAVEIGAIGFLSRIEADLGRARATLPNGIDTQAAKLHLALDVPEHPATVYTDPFIGFDVAAEDLTLPPGTHLLTTDPLGKLAARGAILGPVPALPRREALMAWRDAGGVLDLKSFAFAQGPLSITGGATVALDRNLQPEGAANLVSTGLAPTLDLLATQGAISPADALKFKAFVQGLSRPGPDGTPETRTSFTVQDGVVSLGPFPLARVPQIAW